MHKAAECCRREEAHACASGGIRAALEVTVSRERRAVIGALKCLYFLAKNEIPHRVSYRIFCWGGRSNCKGSASVRKHGHTRVSVRAT